MTTPRRRLPAGERRAALLDCACRAFAAGSYRGTTTAEIADEAGVTEPVLYRHFDSKRDLYLACIGDMWQRARALWEDAIAREPDPGLWPRALGHAFLDSEEHAVLSHLWIQSLAEASEDPEIRRALGEQLREVHEFGAEVIRRAQAAGAVAAGRDAEAEAWIGISLAMLSMADRTVGGLVGDQWEGIVASRVRWLTGRG